MIKTIFKNDDRKNKKILKKINGLEDQMKSLSNEELSAKTEEFKERYKNGTKLKDLLVESFAVSREATFRVLGKRPYDVQILGGLVLYSGDIAEMKTGEGKTITEIMPAYIHAITGKGVHIITVNDYLAKRDKEEMGKVFNFLGLTVDWIYPDMDDQLKKKAYKADILYGTNKEFGFDYLRDNLANSKTARSQRGLYYAIIDEVDSILIDESRTPLIISGQQDKDVTLYVESQRIVSKLKRGKDISDQVMLSKVMDRLNEVEDGIDGDYAIQVKTKTVVLGESGIAKVEKYFGVENLGDAYDGLLLHHINTALKANYTMKNNVDYMVQNDEVVIIDEATGRAMDGRRYSDGLHQALEAKEKVSIKGADDTKATITLQNFFRLYEVLSGMTGTAKTDEAELKEVYALSVNQIPTNRPNIRVDKPDVVYVSEKVKFEEIIKETIKLNQKGAPILIGTTSVQQSESLSNEFSKKGIRHNVLNAKNHEQEAAIISQSGEPYAITIATNMAGRGTDIILGGNPEQKAIARLLKEDFVAEHIDMAIGFEPSQEPEFIALREHYFNVLAEEKRSCASKRESVLEAGGLHVIGTQKHDSRRIDDQLRGRAGRQGDPGSSVFMLSLEDDIITKFENPHIAKLKRDYEEDGIVDAIGITKIINTMQKRVENQNYESRKSVLEYDEVDDVQRSSIYRMRNEIIDHTFDFDTEFEHMTHHYSKKVIDNLCPTGRIDLASFEMLEKSELLHHITLIQESEILKNKDYDFELKFFTKRDAMTDELARIILEVYRAKNEIAKMKGIDDNTLNANVMLHSIDIEWSFYIVETQNMKDQSRLSSLGNTQPIDVYKSDCIDRYQELLERIDEQIVYQMMNVYMGVSYE